MCFSSSTKRIEREGERRIKKVVNSMHSLPNSIICIRMRFTGKPYQLELLRERGSECTKVRDQWKFIHLGECGMVRISFVNLQNFLITILVVIELKVEMDIGHTIFLN